MSSNDKAILLDSDDDNNIEVNRTPTKHMASASKVRNIVERNSNDDITSGYKMSGKRVSSSKSRIELGSDDEGLLSPFEDVKPRRSIKGYVLLFDGFDIF
jgi:hypothetical protein